LVAAGLLALSFRNLVRRDVGFRDPAGLVAARAPLTGPRYQSPVAQRQFYDALVSRSAALPGVRHAGLIDEVPGGGSAITTFEPVDHPIPRSVQRSEEHTSELQSLAYLVCRLLLEKKKSQRTSMSRDTRNT